MIVDILTIIGLTTVIFGAYKGIEKLVRDICYIIFWHEFKNKEGKVCKFVDKHAIMFFEIAMDQVGKGKMVKRGDDKTNADEEKPRESKSK